MRWQPARFIPGDLKALLTSVQLQPHQRHAPHAALDQGRGCKEKVEVTKALFSSFHSGFITADVKNRKRKMCSGFLNSAKLQWKRAALSAQWKADWLLPWIILCVFEPKCLVCLVSAGQDGWQLIPHTGTVSLWRWQCHHRAPTAVALTCACSHGIVPALICCQGLFCSVSHAF